MVSYGICLSLSDFTNMIISSCIPVAIYYSFDLFYGRVVFHCAWEIPWTEEPGRLQSMGLWRVGHDWATSLLLFTFMHWRRKWQPTPVFLPGESQGQEPGGLPSTGSHRVRHDWHDLAAAVFHCVYVPQSVNGHLGFFQVLAIANSAAINTGMYASFQSMLFSGYMPRSKIAGHMVILFTVLWGTSALFSTVAVPTYIPTNSVGGFPFLHILSRICYL